MLKTFTQQLDKTTVAVIASVFIITLYTITSIHDVFVDRLIIQDAHTLSKSVADKIRGEFFPDNILEASNRRTRSFTVGVRKHSDNYASNLSIGQNSIFDPKNF